MSLAEVPLEAACARPRSASESEPPADSEQTLAIVKPEAYGDADAIVNAIVKNGFTVLAKRHVHLTPEQAADLYKNHYGQEYFPQLVAHMTSGPVLALVLAAADALERWRTLMGPKRVQEAQAYWPDSLRASFGRRTDYGDYYNGLHGSENAVEARREIHFFFPTMSVGPVLRPWQVRDYIRRHIAPTLQPALAALSRMRPAEPLLWLAGQLRDTNPHEPVWRSPQGDPDKCCTPSHSEPSLASN